MESEIKDGLEEKIRVSRGEILGPATELAKASEAMSRAATHLGAAHNAMMKSLASPKSSESDARKETIGGVIELIEKTGDLGNVFVSGLLKELRLRRDRL